MSRSAQPIGRLLFAALVACAAPAARAWDEAAIASSWEQSVLPLLAGGEAGTLTGMADVRLRYRKYQQRAVATQLPAAVIVPDYDESAAQYAELAAALVERGHTVFVWEHRRVESEPGVIDTESIDHYASDYRQFADGVARQGGGGRVIVIAHGFGALVAVLHAAYSGQPTERMILSAPLFTPVAPWWLPDSWLGPVAQWFTAHDLATAALFGPFHGDRGVPWRDANGSTHSRARYERMLLPAGSDGAAAPAAPSPPVAPRSSGRAPSAEVSVIISDTNGSEAAPRAPADYGPLTPPARHVTARWVASLREGVARLATLAPNLTMPILVLTAAQDQYAAPDDAAAFCRAVVACRLFVVEGAWHDLLLEADPLREPALRELEQFLNEVPVTPPR